MDPFPTLKTKWLLLREFRHTDAQSVFEIFSHCEVTQHLDSDMMRRVEEEQEKVSSLLWPLRSTFCDADRDFDLDSVADYNEGYAHCLFGFFCP